MRGAGKRSLRLAFWGAAALALAAPASAARPSYSAPLPRTTFGSIGLIEMPSARMAPDGELSLSASLLKNTQRFDFGAQALPWLNLSFRYSGIGHFRTGGRTYYDHSFGARLRVFQEGAFTPAISIGMRDVMGNGVYAGEYIVASKRIFDDFDATIGMGWGRLGSTGATDNPLRHISGSFRTRAPVNMAARADFGQLFHGPKAGLFGGVVWRTPIPHLSLIAEYSSDRYLGETASGSFRPRTQLNFGANYQLFDTVQLGLSWLYGRSIGVSLSIDANPTKPIYTDKVAPASMPVTVRTAQQQMAALIALQRKNFASNLERPSIQRFTIPPDAISRFADAAIGRNSPAQGIGLNGRTILVSATASTNTMARCQHYARLAAAYLSDVDRVVLTARRAGNVSCYIQPAIYVVPWHGRSLTDRRSLIRSAAFELPPQFPTEEVVVRGDTERRIQHDAEKQFLKVEAVALTKSDATVYFANAHYSSEANAVGRMARVLMKDAPPDVEIFHLISMADDVPAQEYQILRGPMERQMAELGTDTPLHGTVTMRAPDMDSKLLAHGRKASYPHFSWNLYPVIGENFFDPGHSARFAVLVGVSGKLSLAPGVDLRAALEGNLWNNFNRTSPSASTLPHVRSDLAQYYKHGANGIEKLSANYHFRLAPNVFGTVKGGYLESMFGGVGGEVLWRPEHSRFAFGVDLYEAWQRGFDRLFSFKRYHVTIGHAAVYYASPWYDLNFRMLAGRYLAGDWGTTFEISRRFNTGVEIGAFATFTNVPYNKFGEGSFDKGIMIRIPLDWALPITTQSAFNLEFRRLTSDGGQRLEGDATLYDDTERSSYGAVMGQWDGLTNP